MHHYRLLFGGGGAAGLASSPDAGRFDAEGLGQFGDRGDAGQIHKPSAQLPEPGNANAGTLRQHAQSKPTGVDEVLQRLDLCHGAERVAESSGKGESLHLAESEESSYKCDRPNADEGHVDHNKSPDCCPTLDGKAAAGASPEPVRNETVNHATAPLAGTATTNPGPGPRPSILNFDPAAHLDGIGFHSNGRECVDAWVEDPAAFIETYGLPCTHERAQQIVDQDQESHILAWIDQTEDERRERYALRGV